MGFAKKYIKISYIVLVVFLLQESYGQENGTFETPEYIKPCYKADQNVNGCLTDLFNHLRPYLKNGITDLDVPSIDPLQIDNLLMENGKGPIRVKAVFSNITALGATNFNVTRIKTDFDKLVIELGVHLPKLDITGSYDVNGNVLLFPVRSRGDFWAVFIGVDAAAKIRGKEYTNENNVKFMKVDQMAVDFRLKKSHFRIKDVINHANIIGEAMNQFLNKNSEEIIKEMKPAANVAIARHFKAFLNAAFRKLPMKIWLPDA